MLRGRCASRCRTQLGTTHCLVWPTGKATSVDDLLTIFIAPLLGVVFHELWMSHCHAVCSATMLPGETVAPSFTDTCDALSVSPRKARVLRHWHAYSSKMLRIMALLKICNCKCKCDALAIFEQDSDNSG